MAFDYLWGFAPLQTLAHLVGASEPALRLLLSLLAGYPLLYIHHRFLSHKNATLQHIFFAVAGIGIAIFNNGFNVVHSLVCVLFAWFVLVLIGGTLHSVIVSFIFQMGYLLIAYYVTGTDSYDIKWTMPHCVLTLRLIALPFDVYDGTKKHEKLSADQQKTALKIRPTLLEIAGQTYFPASFMVGPQFSMRRYLDFINRTLIPAAIPAPTFIFAGLRRGCIGLLFLAVYQVGISFLPDTYLLSKPYMALPFWKRFAVVGIWGKISMYKYISCWLITEGACILSGIAYNGLDADGQPIWNGCANVKFILFETGTTFGTLVKGFNINTNNWLAQYIYKRLKFLNNRYLSQIGALFFLAVWHGFHSGYYTCFLMEFLILFMEKNMESVLKKHPHVVKVLQTPPLSYAIFVLMKAYAILFMGYSIGSFLLLKSAKWWPFYKSVYFVGHIFFGSLILITPLLNILLRTLCPPPVSVSSRDEVEKSSGTEVTADTGTQVTAGTDQTVLMETKKDM